MIMLALKAKKLISLRESIKERHTLSCNANEQAASFETQEGL